MIPQEKQILRERMRGELARFEHRGDASAIISARLRALPEWASAKVIYAFSPLKSEPDWRSGYEEEEKIFALPRVTGEAMLFYTSSDFTRGALGALEPVGGELAPPPDLILVPGLAFDRNGHRLGRGKGFYDRWLAERGHVPAIGICFASQIVEAVPREPHDLHVDRVICEG